MFGSRYFLRGVLTGCAFTTAWTVLVSQKIYEKQIREEIEAELASKGVGEPLQTDELTSGCIPEFQTLKI